MNDPTTERRTASSPPDLPEFRWGDAMGVEEARASLATAVLLENAIAGGELDPGSRGWKARRTELVRFHLTVPRLELDGRSFLDRIEVERLAGWVELGRGPTRRRLVAPLADRLRGPIASPSTADPFPSLTWLLGELATGVAITQTGKLNRAFVQGAAPRFGWDLSRPPHTETDLDDLHQLRHLAQRLGLARRRSGTLSLTNKARALLADDPGLWQPVADSLLDLRPFEATAGEAFFALLLDISSLAYKELLDAVCRVVVEQGWADARTGAPVDRNATSVAMHDTANLCRGLGLLATGGDWQHRRYGLTEVGRTTGLAALRARALGPTTLA